MDERIAPFCCGKRAKYVIQSVNLAYWYCEVCKNEVPEPETDGYHMQLTFSDEIMLPSGNWTVSDELGE